MEDPRITAYHQAALSMVHGLFHVQVPVGLTMDDTDRLGRALLELGEVLERKFTEAEKLWEVTEQVNAGLLLDDVLDHVYDSFHTIIPYDRIGFSLLEEGTGLVRARWARSKAPVQCLLSGFSAPLEGSSLEQIIRTGQPRIINDLAAHLREHPVSHSTRLLVEEGMKSSLTCPLIALNKPIGFMFFTSMAPDTYKEAHVQLFKHIAGQFAVIVEKSRLYQQLVELNEVKNKFMGMAAHDLRSPLGVMIGFVSLLTSGKLGEVSKAQLGILQRMDAVGRGMLVLLNDLLDISAIESGQLQMEQKEQSLASLLQQFHATNEILAQPKSIAFTLALEPDLPLIRVDAHRISQVLYNLLTNAIKFSLPNTTITLRARRENAEAVISLADQGQGIPQAEIPRLFAEFSRTSVQPTAGEKSTGLGLAISRRIVEAHGGRIWAESKPGVGSTFSFALSLQPAFVPAG